LVLATAAPYAPVVEVRRARGWHALTALVAVVALLLQLGLVISGASVLAEGEPPGLATRLGRLVSYFTIQSNLLVAAAAVGLAGDPTRDGSAWRVLRLAGVVGIAITGVVHFVLLRPLLDLEGWNYVADKLLHLAVPLLAVIGWAAFGPRPRITRRDVGLALVWPFAWLAWTLAVGAASGWYPYPFLDVDAEGWGSVLLASAGITGLFLGAFAGAAVIDRRLPASPAPSPVLPAPR
jgi:hypothetical protein